MNQHSLLIARLSESPSPFLTGAFIGCSIGAARFSEQLYQASATASAPLAVGWMLVTLGAMYLAVMFWTGLFVKHLPDTSVQ